MPKSKLPAHIAFLLSILLVSASTVAALARQHEVQSRVSENLRPSKRNTSCAGFEGNSDFYGLGIRLGVYLQWIASWLTNTLSPNEAGPSHDANSIFVLAIAVAIATSIASDNIKPVEVYVMLLICFGFYFTVLSFLGVRLYFMTPASIAKMFKKVRRSWVEWYDSRKGRWKRIRDSVIAIVADRDGLGSGAPIEVILSTMKLITLGLSFTTASSVKHYALSWSGVVWRTAIASMVASINIYLWWAPWRSHQNAADATHCEASVFFFGRQEMSPTMVTFFKVASIILAVPIFYLFIVLYQVLVVMFQLTQEVVFHRIFKSRFGDGRLFRSWNKLPDPVKKYLFSRAFVPATPVGLSPLIDILGAYLDSKVAKRAGGSPKQDLPEERESTPSLNDLLKAYIVFLSRGTEDTEGDAPHDSQARLFQCFLLHLL